MSWSERRDVGQAVVWKDGASRLPPVNGAGPCGPESGFSCVHKLITHMLQWSLIGRMDTICDKEIRLSSILALTVRSLPCILYVDMSYQLLVLSGICQIYRDIVPHLESAE